MRVAQPAGSKGSLKWIQTAVTNYPEVLKVNGRASIEWVSPRQEDDFAEYRDGSFLALLGLDHMKPALAGFWPNMGPQWDALGRENSTIWLVEAKSHIEEFLSPATKATSASRSKIDAALMQTKLATHATGQTSWAETYYQYTNRLSHLWFLRSHGIDANLLFVSFINDHEMNGPTAKETWEAAFRSADYALGIPNRNPLRRFIHHLYPDVSKLT